MNNINTSISSELASNIEQLSLIKNDQNISSTEKEVKLREAGAKTLAMISNEMDKLSISNKLFVADIKNAIQSGFSLDDWGSIPSPKEVRREINDLQQVNQALSRCISNNFADMTAVMKLIIEISGKYGQAKFSEWISHTLDNMKSAKAQFEKTKQSINEQHTADQTAAIGQIVGGCVSLGMSAGTMIGSTVNLKKQLTALKDQKSINSLSNMLEVKAKAYDQSVENLKSQKVKLADMEANGASATSIKDTKNKISALETMKTASHDNFINAKNHHADLDYKNKRISLKNQTEALHIQGLSSFSGASNSMINGSTSHVSADQRRKANLSKLESDKAEYQKNFDQNMIQSSLEAYHKASDHLRQTIQAMLSLEQGHSNMISQATKV